MEKNTNFRENRQLAWIVFAVVIILAVILSGGSGLRKVRETALSVFRSGADGSGICVRTDISKRVECAYNLAGLAANYKDAVSEEHITAVETAAKAVSSAGESDMKALAEANASMTRAVKSLYTDLDNAALSEKDQRYALSEYKEFDSRASIISHDSYNDEADIFNAVLGIESPLNDLFSLQFTVKDRYNSLPGDGHEKNDICATVGIRIKL